MSICRGTRKEIIKEIEQGSISQLIGEVFDSSALGSFILVINSGGAPKNGCIMKLGALLERLNALRGFFA